MKNIRLIFAFVVFLGLLALASGCSTVPVTGRQQFTGLVSPDQEMQLGLNSFEEMKKTTPINHDPAVNALVQKVGKNIATVAGKDMPNAQWEFVVFDSPELNAFCLPGGKVGVYTGILVVTKDESGMATVLGHEVAHAVARHGAERMSQTMAEQDIGQLLGMSVSKYSPQLQAIVNGAYGLGTQTLVALPFSRAQESEADHIGLVYMARAGYDPKAAVQFWERFMQYNNQHGGSATPAFLRTHPTDATRIQQLKQWLPEAQMQYHPQN